MDDRTRDFHATRAAVTRAILAQMVQMATGALLVFMSQWDKVVQGFQIFFLIAGIFILATSILVAGVTLAQRDRPVFSLRDDHLRVGRQTIPYAGMRSLEKRSARQAVLHHTRDGQPRRLRLPVAVLDEADREAFLAALQQRIPA